MVLSLCSFLFPAAFAPEAHFTRPPPCPTSLLLTDSVEIARTSCQFKLSLSVFLLGAGVFKLFCFVYFFKALGSFFQEKYFVEVPYVIHKNQHTPIEALKRQNGPFLAWLSFLSMARGDTENMFEIHGLGAC